MRHDLSILQLRYTKAQFAATNPTPSSGQLCIETDSGVYTTGDGSSAYLTIRGNSDLSGLDRTSADDVHAAMGLSDSRDDVPPVLHYMAYLMQTGTDAIVPTVLFNNAGIEPVYTYFDVGRQNCALPGIDPLRVFINYRFQYDIQETRVGHRFTLPYDDGQGNCIIQIQQCDINDYDAPTEFDGYGEKVGFSFFYIKP